MSNTLYQQIAEVRQLRARAWHGATSARKHTKKGVMNREEWKRIALGADELLLRKLAQLPRTDYPFPLVIVVPGLGMRFLRKVKRNQAFYTRYDHKTCLDVQWQGTTILEKLAEEADLMNDEEDDVLKQIEIAEVRAVEAKPDFLDQYGDVDLPMEGEGLEEFLERVE